MTFMTIFAILFLMAAFVSGLSFIFFLYESVNDPRPCYLDNCHQASGVFFCLFSGFLTSVSSQMLAYLTYPLGYMKNLWRPKASADSSRPPVLLVHGLYHNAGAWLVFKWMLKRAGFGRVYLWTYPSFGRDFQLISDQLKQVLRNTVEASGGEPVILIGHSLGGLLVRSILADPQARPAVRAAVLLGAPNHGSKLAALALGKLGRGLILDGPLVRSLNAACAPALLPKLNLFSPLDNLVLPNRSLTMEEPGWVQAQTPPISHVSMLYHLPTIRIVLDFLEQAFPALCPATAGPIRPVPSPAGNA